MRPLGWTAEGAMAEAGPGGAGERSSAEKAVGLISRSAADRIAALTAAAAHAPLVMIGLVDGPDLYLVGGHGVDWSGASRIPMTDALTTAVIRTGEPLVLPDVRADPRVPADARV